MSKTKKSSSGHYEVLFIIPNKFTEAEAKEIITKVEGVIEKNDSQVTYREYWGKKKLAYEIKHNAYGYYALAEFDADKTAVANINQTLRLSTDVLRHQIVAKRVKTEEELAKAKSIQEKINTKKEEEAEEAKKKDEKDNKGEGSPAKKTEKKETRKSGEGSEELDKKLEGILSAKDLI